MADKFINVNDLVEFMRDVVEKQESKITAYIRQEGSSRRVNHLSLEVDGMNIAIRKIEEFADNPDNMVLEVGIVQKEEE